jgi:hypothetical protein
LYVGLFALVDYSDCVGIIFSDYLVICWYFNLINMLVLLLDASLKYTHVNQEQSGQSTRIKHHSGAESTPLAKRPLQQSQLHLDF